MKRVNMPRCSTAGAAVTSHVDNAGAAGCAGGIIITEYAT
jgi:hypothetical protein